MIVSIDSMLIFDFEIIISGFLFNAVEVIGYIMSMYDHKDEDENSGSLIFI